MPEEFTISVAGVPIRICAAFPEQKYILRDYLSDETPAFEVCPTDEDLIWEKEELDRRHPTDPYCPVLPDYFYEKLAVFRMTADRMPEYGALLFFGSVVAAEGKAFLFTAPPGTGKTTHSLLWLDTLPQAHILTDDKPFLKLTEEGKVLACSSPWLGKELLGRNESLPLEAICLLERAAENGMEALLPGEAIPMLLAGAHIPRAPVGRLKALRLLDGICRGVKLYRLQCTPDPSAAALSIRTLLGSIPS